MCEQAAYPCWHGTCVLQRGASGDQQPTCHCDALYNGTLCAYRQELAFFELPLASVAMVITGVLGARIAQTAMQMLRFAEDPRDRFAFPRAFCAVSSRRYMRWLGWWQGPHVKHVIWRGLLWKTRVWIGIAVMMEALLFLQCMAIPFLPIVPWPRASRSVAYVLRLTLLHPLWSHLDPAAISRVAFFAALGFVPVGAVVVCALGVKRFPLFKPQPKSSASEDLCTIALRVYSEWVGMPVVVLLLLPLECLFIGYQAAGDQRLFIWPMVKSACFSWIHAAFVLAGTIVAGVYWFVTAAVQLQLNCESSNPVPTLWSDARYVQVVSALRVTLALSIVAFGNANPLALCACAAIASALLLLMNSAMRPCYYDLVNWIRVAGSGLALWTALYGVAVAALDDPSNAFPYETWSLGALAISIATVSALIVQLVDGRWVQCLSMRATTTLFKTHAADTAQTPTDETSVLHVKRKTKLELFTTHRTHAAS